MNIPVKNFQIYGDLPGEVIERLNRKFGVGASVGAGAPSDDKENHNPGSKPATSVPTPSTANSSTTASTSTPSSIPSKPTTPPRDPTSKFRNNLEDFVENMLEKNPEDDKMTELAELLARIPTSLSDTEFISGMVQKGVSRREILSLACMIDDAKKLEGNY